MTQSHSNHDPKSRQILPDLMPSHPCRRPDPCLGLTCLAHHGSSWSARLGSWHQQPPQQQRRREAPPRPLKAGGLLLWWLLMRQAKPSRPRRAMVSQASQAKARIRTATSMALHEVWQDLVAGFRQTFIELLSNFCRTFVELLSNSVELLSDSCGAMWIFVKLL